MSQCTEFCSNSRQLPAGTRGLLSEPLGSHNKGGNTRLISAVGDVRHDQFLQTQQPQNATRLGLGHTAVPALGHRNNHSTAPMVSCCLQPPQDCVYSDHWRNRLCPFSSKHQTSSSTSMQGLGSWVSPQLFENCHENLTQPPAKFSQSLKAFPKC